MLKKNRHGYLLLWTFAFMVSCSPQNPFQTKNGAGSPCHGEVFKEAGCLKDWNQQMLAGISAKYESINAIAAVFRKYHEAQKSGAFEILPAWQKQQGFEAGQVQENAAYTSEERKEDDELVSFMLLQGGDNGQRFANYASYLNGLSSIMQAQGENVAARGQYLMNLAQYNKSFSEVEGLKIKNIGEGIANVGKHLNNLEQAVEIHLKRHYAAAYSSYIRTFQDYSEFMGTTYARLNRTGTATIGTITRNLRRYDRQMAICSARARRIWEMRLVEANEEMQTSKLTYYNIGEQFSGFTARPYGEQCLHRVLLTNHGAEDSIFNNLSFRVLPTKRGNVFGVKCPVRREGLPDQAAEDVRFSHSFDLMEYPEYIRAKEAEKDKDGNFVVFKNQVTGVYRPATLYQFYKVMTNRTYRVVLNPPLTPENDRDRCEFVRDGELFDSQHPARRAYFDFSRAFENEMKELVTIEEDNLLGSYNTYPSIDLKEAQTSMLNGNDTYAALLKRLDLVFAKVEGCIAAQQQRFAGVDDPLPALPASLDDEAPAPGEGEGAGAIAGMPALGAPPVGTEVNILSVSDLGPLIAGEPSKSYLSAFDDPKLPKASESIRMCVALAEEHRFQAFQKLELITAAQEVLARLSETKPPRSPHPVQFEPAVGNLQNAGNDFLNR